MLALPKTLIRATLTMIGTIIGAGIFGIPAMMERVGAWPGTLIFWIVALMVLCVHLLFIEIIEHVTERRRLPGYLGAALGPLGKSLGVLTHTLQLTGANLAYLILGGEFLWLLSSHYGIKIDLLTWQILFWIGVGMVVLLALQLMAKIESFLTWCLIGVMLLLIFSASTQVQISLVFLQNWSQLLAPLGIFVFSMFGLTAIPEVHEITLRNKSRTRRAIVWGTVIAATLTWIFGYIVVLALKRDQLSAIQAINLVMPSVLWWVVPTFGLLAVATSFITSAFDLKSMFNFDLRIPRSLAWGIALGAPFVLLLTLTRDFISILDIVGALFTASNGLLVSVAAMVIMHRARDKHKHPHWWKTLVPLLTAILFLITIIQRVLILL